MLRNPHPAVGDGDKFRLLPHGCGVAAEHEQRRRRCYTLRFAVNDGGPDA